MTRDSPDLNWKPEPGPVATVATVAPGPGPDWSPGKRGDKCHGRLDSLCLCQSEAASDSESAVQRESESLPVTVTVDSDRDSCKLVTCLAVTAGRPGAVEPRQPPC